MAIEKEIKKILVIRLSALGDAIHTLPAVYALRKKFPDAQIDWIIEDKAAAFAENNPLINNIFIINRKNFSLKSFIQLIKKIRKEKYDAALDFQQLFKSGLILGLSGAKRRITLDKGRELSGLFADEIIKTGRELFDKNYHVIKRNLDLTKALGCREDEIKFAIPDFSDRYSAEIKEQLTALDGKKKTIAIAPATTWDNKHWTIQGWRDAIKEFKDSCNIVITAQKKDSTLVSKILDGLDGSIINLTGKTSLADLVYIYKKADLLISLDSGSTHTAWAAGAKAVISLFFASSALRTAPFGKNYISLSADIKCAPCMKKKCRLKSEKNKCTGLISSKDVINAAKNVLQ